MSDERMLRQAIADDLNSAKSGVDMARPSWSSYNGMGEWGVEYLAKAIEALASAVAKLANLNETSAGAFTVEPQEEEEEEEEEEVLCPHGYDSPHKILSDEVLPGDTLGELCWP